VTVPGTLVNRQLNKQLLTQIRRRSRLMKAEGETLHKKEKKEGRERIGSRSHLATLQVKETKAQLSKKERCGPEVPGPKKKPGKNLVAGAGAPFAKLIGILCKEKWVKGLYTFRGVTPNQDGDECQKLPALAPMISDVKGRGEL